MPAASQEWPPKLGVLWSSSVLAWSFEDESFWRGRSTSMAEVVGYAKSMSLTRFKEVWFSFFHVSSDCV